MEIDRSNAIPMQILTKLFTEIEKTRLGMMAQAFNPSNQEEESGGFL